jgi:hypothetical protein
MRPVLAAFLHVAMKHRMALVMPGLLLSSGCLAPGAQGPKAVAASPADAPTTPPDPRLRCEMEKPTGSMIPVQRCRTIEQAEADRRAAQDLLLRPTNAPPPPPKVTAPTPMKSGN